MTKDLFLSWIRSPKQMPRIPFIIIIVTVIVFNIKIIWVLNNTCIMIVHKDVKLGEAELEGRENSGAKKERETIVYLNLRFF